MYLVLGRETCAVSTFVGSNPGLTSNNFSKLRSRSPEQISRTIARAISEITSALRRPCLPEASGVPRPPSFKAPAKSFRAASKAGASPNKTPTTTDTASVKSRTAGSRPIAAVRSRFAGAMRINSWHPHSAINNPSAPPRTARSRLSVRSCVTIRLRAAPIAPRMANSRDLALPRASNRFAMFAQAISRTSDTAPRRMYNGCRTSPTCSSTKGRTPIPKAPMEESIDPFIRAAIVAMVARAAARPTPRRRRPSISNVSDQRRSSFNSRGVNAIGVQNSTSA